MTAKTVTATINGAVLLSDLRFTNQAAEKRSTIPILSCALLELSPSLLTLMTAKAVTHG